MSSQVSYNDIDIEINRVRCARKAIIENGHYLYTRHVIHCVGVFNPEATAYKIGQDGPVVAGNNSSGLPALTDVAVRNHLMRPRKKLYYIVGEDTVLESPWAQDEKQTCDDNNGPKPIACDVVQVHGRKTFIIEFIVQTDIDEQRLFPSEIGGAGIQDVMLSNAYEQEDDLDEHFFLTRITRGAAVFSTGVLQAIDNGFYQLDGKKTTGDPDRFRKGINRLVPVPPFCKRENFRYHVNRDNNTLTYSFVDREQAFNLNVKAYPNIAEIRAHQTIYEERPDELDVFMNKLKGAALGSIAGGFLGNKLADYSFLGTDLRGLGTIGGIGVGAFAGWNLARFSPSNMPKLGTSITLDIFGNNQCSKREMLSAATHILNTQLVRSRVRSNPRELFKMAAEAFGAAGNALEGPGAGANPLLRLAGIQFNFAAGLARNLALAPQAFLDKLAFAGKTSSHTTFDLTGRHLHVEISGEVGWLGTALMVLGGDVKVRLPGADQFGEGDDNADGKGAFLDESYTEGFSPNPLPMRDGVRGYVQEIVTVPHPWEELR